MPKTIFWEGLTHEKTKTRGTISTSQLMGWKL